MSNIKPIETLYKGYRFRSRLEARWAVFFDCGGVEWEYEPEGYDLGDQLYYLPDFRVKCCATRGSDVDPFWLYVEVKGVMDGASAEKIKRFSKWHDYQDEKAAPLLIVGNMPDIYSPWQLYDECTWHNLDGIGYDLYAYNYETVDGDYFPAFPCLDGAGRFGLLGGDSNYVDWGDHLLTVYAYRAARQARFEHGETPRMVPTDRHGKLAFLEAQDLFGPIDV